MPTNAEEEHDSESGPGRARVFAAAAWTSLVRRREVMLSLAGLTIFVFTLLLGRVSDTLILITSSNESIAVPDVEASFSHRISGAGIVGSLSAANPSTACAPLQPINAQATNLPAFLLIERGECNFVTKVQYAQDAGFAAAIVYNNEDGHDLVTMSGNGFGIEIPAVFISKEAGYVLLQFVDDKDARLYMLPALETSAWSILAISSISLLTISAVLSTFFFVRRQQLRRASMRLLHEPTGLTDDEIKALPVTVYSQKDSVSGPESCAICLEDFENGEKLRMLQCNHGFHVQCIDQWLIRRPFCPICKRDVYDKMADVDSSEHTPLLNSITWHMGSTLTPLIPPAANGSSSENVSGQPGDIC